MLPPKTQRFREGGIAFGPLSSSDQRCHGPRRVPPWREGDDKSGAGAVTPQCMLAVVDDQAWLHCAETLADRCRDALGIQANARQQRGRVAMVDELVGQA